MIHYTLLPENEMKVLKREYRMRLFIFILFFISLAITIGIFSLAPAFILSYSEEKDALLRIETIREGRKNKEIDKIVKDLGLINEYIKKINSNTNKIVYSEIIPQIINDKNSDVYINSFQFTDNETANSASSTILIIQGRANTRDALIRFKTKLEQNPIITKVELPVSDLAKSREINYSIRLSLSNK